MSEGSGQRWTWNLVLASQSQRGPWKYSLSTKYLVILRGFSGLHIESSKTSSPALSSPHIWGETVGEVKARGRASKWYTKYNNNCIKLNNTFSILNTINKSGKPKKTPISLTEDLNGCWPLPNAVCRMCFNTEIWGREQHTWDTAHTLLEEVALCQRKQ